MKKEIIIDKFYNFERPIGYIPPAFLTTEAEIRDICKKNRIIVSKIYKFDGYKVYGKRIRNKELFKKIYRLRNKLEQLNK